MSNTDGHMPKLMRNINIEILKLNTVKHGIKLILYLHQMIKNKCNNDLHLTYKGVRFKY